MSVGAHSPLTFEVQSPGAEATASAPAAARPANRDAARLGGYLQWHRYLARVRLGPAAIRPLLAIAVFGAILGGTSAVSAHAFLVHADPAVGSTVHGSPPQLKLWFSEEIESAFSSARVLDPSGKQVDKGDKAVNPSDKTVLTVSLQQLPPAKYKVVWRIVSVDTHKTEGDFTFTVAP
jgi:copper resistance protein C